MIEHFTVSTKQHVRHWRKYSTANRNQKSNRHLEDGQIIFREYIDRAIDDSLRKPEPKFKLESENENVKRGARERDDYRQSGIRSIEAEDFLGLYRYAYGSTGEFLQRNLIKAYKEIEQDPSRSNYYRKIFSSRSGDRESTILV